MIDRLDARLYRHEADPAPDPPWCECDSPRWRSCRPLFASVRECARCGRPDRAQLGAGLPL